jgi:hypothetical protein
LLLLLLTHLLGELFLFAHLLIVLTHLYSVLR